MIKLIVFVVQKQSSTPFERHPSSLLDSVQHVALLSPIVISTMFSSIRACCRCGKHAEQQTCVRQQGVVHPMYKKLYHFYVGDNWGDAVKIMVRLTVGALYWWVGVEFFCWHFFGNGNFTIGVDTDKSEGVICNLRGGKKFGCTLISVRGWNNGVVHTVDGRNGGRGRIFKRICLTVRFIKWEI